jgi:aryl-alcohol dehydrogenase-like predicted oxidoreductase
MSTATRVRHKQLGRTGMDVSVIGFGGGQIGLQKVPPEAAGRLLNTMLDDGLNVIDTASSYLLSEELIGDYIVGRRSDFWLFTKCGDDKQIELPDFSAEKMRQEIDRSLRRLHTEYVDLLLLHTCPKEDLERGDVIDLVRRAKEDGKTRFIGYSGDSDAAEFAIQCGAFDALEISVNIADQEAIDRGLLVEAKKAGMGVIAKRSIANTAWRIDQNELQNIDPYQERLKALAYPFLASPVEAAAGQALRFTLSVEEVDVALVGMRSVEHWKSVLEAVHQGPLPPNEFGDIRRRWSEVKRPEWKGLG